MLIGEKTGFAVGPGGVIVKGTRNDRGLWSWAGLAGRKPTSHNLNSVIYVDDRLWIVGDGGIVLSGRNLGKDWSIQYLKDEAGGQPNLKRIRLHGSSLWIVGDRVVYRYRK